MIAVNNITKEFAGNIAVHSLNFNVNQGEIFGIVGPDGAGKSTLLRLMSAILKPDSGIITIHGIDIYKDPIRIKEKLAYMPQRFGLYEDLTVEENIIFFGRLFNISKREIKKRLKRLYDFSRLGPFSNRLAGNLSGGMKQKLGLACSLVHTPEIILLDEPTNGVDPVSRREFWKILYDLLGDGVTIVVSTAYLDEAERCNRIALMHEGHFIRLGEPKLIKIGVGKELIDITVNKPMEAEFVLQKNDNSLNIFRTGNSLRIFTKDVKKTVKNIKTIMHKNGIDIASITTTIPTLEDSFMEIVLKGDN